LTSSELLLIEKLIQKSVEAEVSKIEDKYKKELTETKNGLVKLAKGMKMLSEGTIVKKNNKRSFIEESEEHQGIREKSVKRSNPNVDRNMIRESITGTPSMSAQGAIEMAANGTLPDFDAPIYIQKNSSVMNELMDKLED
jgi:hypothetical protein